MGAVDGDELGRPISEGEPLIEGMRSRFNELQAAGSISQSRISEIFNPQNDRDQMVNALLNNVRARLLLHKFIEADDGSHLENIINMNEDQLRQLNDFFDQDLSGRMATIYQESEDLYNRVTLA